MAGWLTHYCADINFHPLVWELTNQEPENRRTYRHQQLETMLDKRKNTQKIYVDEQIDLTALEEISFLEQIAQDNNISLQTLKKVSKRWIKFNKLFRNPQLAKVVNLVTKFSNTKNPLGMFYGNPDSQEIPENQTTPLFKKTIIDSTRAIEIARSYYANLIDEIKCQIIIPARSLETGLITHVS